MNPSDEATTALLDFLSQSCRYAGIAMVIAGVGMVVVRLLSTSNRSLDRPWAGAGTVAIGVVTFLVPNFAQMIVPALGGIFGEPADPADSRGSSPEPLAGVEDPVSSPEPPLSDDPGVPSWAITVGIVVAAIAVLTIVIGLAMWQGRKLHARRSEKAGQDRIRDAKWDDAVARHRAVLSEYAALECDPIRSLQLPLLFGPAADLDGPGAGFLDALADAGALRTDQRPGPLFAERYAEAVNSLVRAWENARDEARRVGMSRMPAETRRRTQIVVDLLTRAQGSDNEFERHAFYSKANDLLADLVARGEVKVPARAHQALDAATTLSIEQREPV